jgi:8-oxo-dGTP diphosphatase
VKPRSTKRQSAAAGNASRGRREYPERPIVGVGAVVIDHARVLLVRRGSPPLLGEWSLPGGVVELGETLRAAAEREAREETGLAVEAGAVLEVLDRIIPGKDGAPQYHYVLIDFLCSVKGGRVRAGGDAADARWAREDELAEYKLEQPAMDVIGKAFLTAKDAKVAK